MTNAREMVDKVRSRPSEAQKDFGLPDEIERVNILKFYTWRARAFNKLGPDVDIGELGSLTKNFSDLELGELVKVAKFSAIDRELKTEGKMKIDWDVIENLKINREDFINAFEKLSAKSK